LLFWASVLCFWMTSVFYGCNFDFGFFHGLEFFVSDS
jgi:hypothetical protein